MECGTPPDGMNTKPAPESQSWNVLDRYTYSCQDGYVANNDLCVVCDLNGEWHPSPPNCIGTNLTVYYLNLYR